MPVSSTTGLVDSFQRKYSAPTPTEMSARAAPAAMATHAVKAHVVARLEHVISSVRAVAKKPEGRVKKTL
jgi:hypothetical protein